MARNVHKTDAKVINLPTEQLAEDRGYKFCGKPYLTFANPDNGSISWQNDLFSVAFIADSVEVVLEKDGTELTAFGINLDFPYQPDAVGFMIIWREVLLNHGAGCYKVKANYTLQGFEFTLHYGSFDLMPYSVAASELTIRVLGQYNDKVKMYGINFAGSNFARTFRVKGNLHNEQPNTEHGNILKGDDKFAKYRNHGQISYDLETAPLVACELDPLFEIIIASNRVYLSDFNSANFRQYRDIEVVLRDEDEISYGEQFGHERQLLAPFKQKQWLIESKYSEGTGQGQIFTSGLDFGNLVCPTVVCDDATVNVNKSDSTLIQAVTAPSGGLESYNVADSTITVNSATFASVKATDSLNVPVVDSNGDAVATTVVGGEVQVDDLPCASVVVEEWERPKEWLDIPAITTGEEVIYALFAVYEGNQNYVAFKFSGAYEVDWGDGNPTTTHASGSTAENNIQWADADPTTLFRGYRQVLITIRPQTGQTITSLVGSFSEKHSLTANNYTSNFLDIVLNVPNATGSAVSCFNGANTRVRNNFLERIKFTEIGAVTDITSFVQQCKNLFVLEFPDSFNTATIIRGMTTGCNNLIKFTMDVSSVTSMLDAFNNSGVQKIELLNMGTTTTNAKQVCRQAHSLKQITGFNAINAGDLSTAFFECESLQDINNGGIIPFSGTNIFVIIRESYSLKQFHINCTNLTSWNATTFQNQWALEELTLEGMTYSFSVADSSLSATAIDALANSVSDMTGLTSPTVTFGGNNDTAGADLTLWSAKNWTVVT